MDAIMEVKKSVIDDRHPGIINELRRLVNVRKIKCTIPECARYKLGFPDCRNYSDESTRWAVIAHNREAATIVAALEAESRA